MGNCCSPGCRLWCLWWCLFVLSFFPRGILDEILNLIEPVSEGFPSYSIKSQISFQTPRGKKDSTKDATKDTTNDSQVNSYFPYRWSPASLTINIYFYLFLYLYPTRIMITNGTPHLKSLKSQNRRAAFGRLGVGWGGLN